jgi:hypothetical protein
VTLEHFAREYAALPPGEQALFAEAVRRLLADGLLWREDDRDRRLYTFVARRRELLADYLRVAGWELRYHERQSIFQVVHLDGAHRHRLTRKTTEWLLLLRLLYAERREKLTAELTRYPVVSVAEVFQRYTEFFPGQRVREKTSLDEALRSLQGLKLIRAATGGSLRAANSDQLIELLPALEVIVPAPDIAALAERLRDYQLASAEDSSELEAGQSLTPNP